MWHVCGRGVVNSGVLGGGSVKERDHRENLGLVGMKLLKLVFKK
jgi:hypothetical protein